jgi:hypothetical protein
MIAPFTAPRPAELCANESANGMVVASTRKNNNDRIRCIGHSSRRLISYGCAPHSSQDENEIQHNALPLFSTSCEAAGSPVCADIECDDNVTSVNAARGQVVHDAC